MQNQVGLPPASPARTLHDRQTSRDQPELHSRHSSPDPTCHHLDASCRRLPATCCTICARSSQAEQPVCPTRLPGGYALPSPTRSSCKSSKGAGRSRLRAGQLDSRIRLKSQARCEAHCSRSQGGASPQLLREPGGRVPWANPSREGSQLRLGALHSTSSVWVWARGCVRACSWSSLDGQGGDVRWPLHSHSACPSLAGAGACGQALGTRCESTRPLLCFQPGGRVPRRAAD